MFDDIQGKTALITGGSDGIGYAIAEVLAHHQVNLILVGRHPDKLQRQAERLHHKSITIQTLAIDLATADAMSELQAQLECRPFPVDILINNAGIALFSELATVTPAEYHQQLQLNLTTPYFLTQHMLPDLMKTQGTIVNISSYFARRMLSGRPSSVYSMTKGGMESLTRSLAFELGEYGIRVNAIAPGTIDTPQVKRNLDGLPDAVKLSHDAMVQANYPLQHIGTPQDIANMTLFLVSNAAKWITGSIMTVDGGLTTH